MANLCEFEMHIKGARENIDLFLSAMQQKGKVYMGRGAVLEDISYDNKAGYAEAFGYCKWSVYAALTENAMSMRTNQDRWVFTDENGNLCNASDLGLEFITLEEACEKYAVTVEIYSTEPGNCFAEHYIVTPSGFEESEECTYREIDFDDYESKKEAEKKLGVTISEDEWAARCKAIGGFEHEFSVG